MKRRRQLNGDSSRSHRVSRHLIVDDVFGPCHGAVWPICRFGRCESIHRPAGSSRYDVPAAVAAASLITMVSGFSLLPFDARRREIAPINHRSPPMKY